VNVANLDSSEKDLLLRWFLHHMPMGDFAQGQEPTAATRHELMRNYPVIYNKLAGRECARVIHAASGQAFPFSLPAA